jgi:glycosyltransferase involved in cell wall biosynthesis
MSCQASVIIPVHNEAKTLGRCLGALAAQTGAPDDLDIIVVDDASRDGTAEVAQAYGVRVVALPVQQGPAVARNAGAAEARGEVLLFIDADCEAAPDWCQEMLRPLAAADIGGAYGAYRSRQTGWVARLAQAEFEERYARLARRESIDFFATHAAAIRRTAFLQMGGFRSDLRGNEDVELAFRLSQGGYRLAFAPRAVVYHEHPTALRSYLRTKVSRGYWRTLAYAAHPAKAVADAYTPPWLKLQVAGMAAAAVMLGLSVLDVIFCYLFVLVASGVVLTTLPFTLFVSRTQPKLVFVAPLFSLARSAALALGVIAGLAAVAIGKHRGAKTPRHKDIKA